MRTKRYLMAKYVLSHNLVSPTSNPITFAEPNRRINSGCFVRELRIKPTRDAMIEAPRRLRDALWSFISGGVVCSLYISNLDFRGQPDASFIYNLIQPFDGVVSVRLNK